MSKMLRIHEFGSTAGLQLDEVEQRQPGKGEALLDVKATGITGDQLTFIKGNFHPGEPVPPLPAPQLIGKGLTTKLHLNS